MFYCVVFRSIVVLRQHLRSTLGVVSPMGMVLTVENSEQFVKDLKTLLGASLTTNPAAEDEEEDDELDYAGLPS